MKKHWTIIWFSLVVVLQIAVLARIPSGQIEALQTGRAIRLKAYAMDRNNIWSGAYLRLKYDLSSSGLSRQLQNFRPGTEVFVIIQQDENGTWNAVRVSKEKQLQLILEKRISQMVHGQQMRVGVIRMTLNLIIFSRYKQQAIL